MQGGGERQGSENSYSAIVAMRWLCPLDLADEPSTLLWSLSQSLWWLCWAPISWEVLLFQNSVSAWSSASAAAHTFFYISMLRSPGRINIKTSLDQYFNHGFISSPQASFALICSLICSLICTYFPDTSLNSATTVSFGFFRHESVIFRKYVQSLSIAGVTG